MTSPHGSSDPVAEGAAGPGAAVDADGDERFEQALHLREQQLAEAQAVAHVGSWEWDVVSGRTSWSTELYRLFGADPAEVEPSYEAYLEHVHPEDRATAVEQIGGALAGEDRFEYDYRSAPSARPDGSVLWLRSRGHLVRDADGAPLIMRGTSLDITDTKLAEEALARTTARYRLLQRMGTAANEASTLAEVLSTALEEVCDHLGWPVGHAYLPHEQDSGVLVPSTIWHLDDPDGFETLRAVTMETSFRTGEAVVGGRLLDERPVWVADITKDPSHVRAHAAPDLGVRSHIAFSVRLDGHAAAVLELFSPEVTEPDQGLLDTLVQVGSQLVRVAERERANAEVAKARDVAMESSRLKSEFLATMSHEIRTPMNGVIGLTGLLLGTELDDRQRQYAEGVRGAGEALLAIINDILDFSKIEAGRLELEMVDFDLVQVVEDAADLVADSARRKGLELVAYCFPDLPGRLRGDPSRLRQVLLNLTSNAIKFTGEGEVVVRARLAASSDDATVVRFEVADTGIGIAEADQQRLFEPFSQADASTTRRFGGTGLGLAISSQLVAAMGGELGVDSEPGRGATFWFNLPFGVPVGAASGPARPFHHLLEGRRVLVIDDNDTNRVILHEQLTAWDMRPEVTPDGPSGLERLQEAARDGRPFDLVILDMCMPAMDGLDVAERISGDPDLALPLILLTSTVNVSPSAATAAGIDALLTKPVRLSQLYDSLMRLTAPSLEHEAAEAAGLAQPSGSRTSRDAHVLVVEDNATNQMVAVGILRNLGYAADVAANGIEALDALERRDYAAVLMDCQMPEMDGYTATAEVRRRQGRARHTPVIAMTAGASEGDRERCLTAGMDDYIAKPVTPDDVAAALDRWLGAAPVAAAPAAVDDDEDDGAAVIDVDRLEVLRQVGPDDGSLLRQVVDAFQGGAASDLAAMEDAVTRGDAAALRYAAHRLRGAAANVGATSVADRCRELEELGEAGELEGTGARVCATRQALDRSLPALVAAVAPPPA